jgi:AcrR family transcriptional regulator
MLQEAALALAEEVDFDAMTVRDITARADVNRATFYQHYRDKDDLMARALDALFEEVTAEDRAYVDDHPAVEPGTVPPPLVALFRHLDERRALYRRLFGEGESSSGSFASRLQLFEEAQFRRVWTEMGLVETPGSPPMELRARVATSVVRGVIVWWLCGDGAEEGCAPAPVETVAGWLWDLVSPLWFTGAGPGTPR